MKYVALLRGINVGGNNIIKMVALKESFESMGFQNVQTYIQSGNVIFESDDIDIQKITEKIEAHLTKTFNYTAVVVVKSQQQMKDIVTHIPKDWETRTDIRCYVAFLRDTVTAEEAVKEMDTKEGIDTITKGPGAVYMTTLLSGLTKSALNKLPSKKIYKDITIRNYNTTRKLYALMETKLE